jgi:hypothetical protein
MILFRYRYRPLKVIGPPLQNVIVFGPPLQNVIVFGPPLQNVTVFGPPLQNVTVFFKGYIPLPSVRNRDTIVTSVTQRY